MKTMFPSIVGLYLATAVLSAGSPAQAQTFPKAPQNCVYLREVTTGRTFIRKTIASNNSNANTDFVVPPGTKFTNYDGKFIPENNARYQVEANLKYADNTTSQVINRAIQARRFYLYQQPFRTPTAAQPFQVNARITGDRNTAYQIAILACR
ncbi:MAG: hypothetical protein NW220_01385 [Leptolyngbyaceae cyanobacterium bins.349]|nr:hypothetical protein [Leptolyngbyaceae cyanobacterium bins.349]